MAVRIITRAYGKTDWVHVLVHIRICRLRNTLPGCKHSDFLIVMKFTIDVGCDAGFVLLLGSGVVIYVTSQVRVSRAIAQLMDAQRN